MRWMFLFFKQKTAYEMRISDWSSDVCSSDLHAGLPDRDIALVVDFGFRRLARCGGRDEFEQRVRRAIESRIEHRPRIEIDPPRFALGQRAVRRDLQRRRRKAERDRKSTRLNSSH